MVGVNICYCPWNWKLQKSKHPPKVRYGRDKHLLLPLDWLLQKFKHPRWVKYGRGKLLFLPLELGTAEVPRVK